MGTDEPVEHWAPPESLDPTPVWRQYLLVALLVLGLLAAVGLYAFAALSIELAEPPAVVPGDRVVLRAAEHPPGTTKRVEVAGPGRAFYLANVLSEPHAIAVTWAPAEGAPMCEVVITPPETRANEREVFRDSCTGSLFDARGDVVIGEAARGLDRYLVSRKGDRLVVNLDRPIRGARR